MALAGILLCQTIQFHDNTAVRTYVARGKWRVGVRCSTRMLWEWC